MLAASFGFSRKQKILSFSTLDHFYDLHNNTSHSFLLLLGSVVTMELRSDLVCSEYRRCEESNRLMF